jgi:hypothetical protein
MSDTTLCVKYAQKPNSMQRVFFSYSSPTGQPAFVLSTSVYDSWCNYLGSGPDIPAGTDTMTICYEIQAELIDNFCPYAIILNALAVGAPAVPGLRIFSPDPSAMRFLLAAMFP